MNYHFISFLFDVLTWGIFGILVANLLISLESIHGVKKVTTTMILFLVAICSGCFSVMTHGLPDVGYSWKSLLMVLPITFTQALFLSSVLRRRTKEALIILYGYVHVYIKDVKGGVLYGNSR